jgi:hypothetical protein
MPDMNAPLKLGANLWNQYTDWPGFLDAMLRAEDLGFDSLFTWDHVYPIVGSWEGPAFERGFHCLCQSDIRSSQRLQHCRSMGTNSAGLRLPKSLRQDGQVLKVLLYRRTRRSS